MVEFAPEQSPGGLIFEDRVPHGTDGVPARKTLDVTSAGYRETLEIDRGSGDFEAYSSIEMRRVSRAE